MVDLNKIDIIPLVEIYKARENAPIEILDTPLVKLNMEFPDKEIYLKLENVQPTGSFKVRGAYNAMINADQKMLGLMPGLMPLVLGIFHKDLLGQQISLV